MILYGHRGAKGEAPENTVSGFLYAWRQGGRAFELDVRLSADQEVVVLHDATVDRTTNGQGAVSEMTWEQLSRLDARADFPEWPEPCFIPTLAQVLAALPPAARFEIEIKRDDPARLAVLVSKLIPLLHEYEVAERVTLSSFDPVALELARDLAPALPRAFIGAYDTPQFLGTALELECQQADIPLTTGSAQRVKEAQESGLRVTGWPGDTVAQLTTLCDWGVDAITSNFPGVALPFLHERGHTGN
jgi:glycerophosphoryl diester phosphodiesterase